MSIFKNKRIAIVGFGMEGQDAYRYFTNRYAKIDVYDIKSIDKGLSIKYRIPLENKFTGKDYLKNGLNKYDFVVRSPGVRPDLPEFVEARENGVRITSVSQIFLDQYDGEVIGVTGTKGKGTTSTLIYEILASSGDSVGLAGNIGTPMLDILDSDNTPEKVVLELSSFQLMDMRKSPNISVVLNITLDHLDWHKNRDEYVHSKESIVKHQKAEDKAVINYDYSLSRSYDKLTSAEVYYFSTKKEIKGCYVKDKDIYLNINEPIKICSTKDLVLRGAHNWENVCAAILAACLAGGDIKASKKTVSNFKGLEHRLEYVREVNGVKYYNDSFSTNIQTTEAAIKAFYEPITLILGGYDKGIDYENLVNTAVNIPNLESVILIGDLAKKYEKWFAKRDFSGQVINLGYSDMKSIVEEASLISESGGIVLLSPSTSSFDMFKDYKQRGKLFKKFVDQL